MKTVLKLKLVLLIGIVLLCNPLTAQEISDVSFELVDQNINIYYTLSPVSSDDFKITLALKRTSLQSFNYIPEDISGDIGEGKFSGTNRKIVWLVSNDEMNMFDGDDFYFRRKN